MSSLKDKLSEETHRLVKIVAAKTINKLHEVETKKLNGNTARALVDVELSEATISIHLRSLDDYVSSEPEQLIFEDVCYRFSLEPGKNKDLKIYISLYNQKEIDFNELIGKIRHYTNKNYPVNVVRVIIKHLEGLALRSDEAVLHQIYQSMLWGFRSVTKNQYSLLSLNALTKNAPAIKNLIRHESIAILKKVEELQNQPVGVMLSRGTIDHAVGLELRKNDFYYEIVIANVGLGAKNVDFETFTASPVTVYRINNDANGQSIFEETVHELNNLKYLHHNSESEDMAADDVDAFYNLFRNNPAFEEQEVLVAPRPLQKSGSCTATSPMELIYYKLQTLGKVDLANVLQNEIFELGKEFLSPNDELYKDNLIPSPRLA